MLAQIVSEFHSAPKMHADFRLILSSAPCEAFPSDVLRNAVKLTLEPPSGLRANLLNSLAERNAESTWLSTASTVSQSASSLASASGVAPPFWNKLLYTLCFFHAIVLERKKFGPLGWNVGYEFNDSDLDVSITTLRLFLSETAWDSGEEIPWSALQYITGDVLYGGRVTDQWDLRCLSSIIKRYYAPAAVLSAKVPTSPGQAIDVSEGPEVFGMDDMAEKVYQRQEAGRILHTLGLMQSGASLHVRAISQNDTVAALAAEMLSSLPPLPTNLEDFHSSLRNDNAPSDTLVIFLRQEVSRYDRLLGAIRTSLSELVRAIKGLAVMSRELEETYYSLLSHTVPKSWMRISYPSDKPLLSYMRDLHARVAFVREWAVSGAPHVFWLSGLFFPQGFLTGVLQQYARKQSIPIDTLSFSFRVLEEYHPENIKQPPQDGVYIHGLFLNGAKWDSPRCVLSDAADGEIYSPFPIVQLIPRQNCILVLLPSAG